MAETPRQLREVIARGAQLYQRDRYAVPPHLPSLQRALAQAGPLLAVQLDALPRGPMERGVGLEVPVASAVVRRIGGEACLTLFKLVNDAASLERLLMALSEELAPLGVRSLVGPCEASPYLGAGALTSHWQAPPLMTPYNPPYLPELLLARHERAATLTLYAFSAEQKLAPYTPASLAPLKLPSLAHELLGALQAACEAVPFAPPDEGEARLMASLLAPYPLGGAVARLKGSVVGMALWAPDLSRALKYTSGARGVLGRLMFALFKTRPVTQGRLLFLGVLPEARGQGVGSQLLAHALEHARIQGWQRVTIGPVVDTAPGARWLRRRGAEAVRHYALFRFGL